MGVTAKCGSGGREGYYGRVGVRHKYIGARRVGVWVHGFGGLSLGLEYRFTSDFADLVFSLEAVILICFVLKGIVIYELNS